MDNFLTNVGVDGIVLIAALVAVVLGAELLVRGSLMSARRHSWSPTVAAALIMGFGTALPEMGVTAWSAFRGEPGVAYGTIVGSNIANIWLVLAIPALIATVRTTGAGLRQSMLFLLIAVGAWVWLTRQPVLASWAGLALLAVLVAYLLVMLFTRDVPASRHLDTAEPVEAADAAPEVKPAGGLLLILAGLVMLPVGANLLVDSAQTVATRLGVSDSIIGLTLLAIGTSLPEIAAGLAAAVRGRGDMVLGNVLGSSVFNLLAGGAVLAAFNSAPPPVSFHVYDHAALVLATVMLAGFVFFRATIGRLFSLVFLILYGAYMLGLVLGASRQPDWPLAPLAPGHATPALEAMQKATP